MDEQAFDGQIPGFVTAGANEPTPEQAAILGYLNLSSDGSLLSRNQAAALISQAENDLANRERLQSWHRDKYRLHPELFTPPQRSFREARWWQARVADDPVYSRGFGSLSLNQALTVLESLDRQAPGWEREAKNRRETRFLNELATLAPDLRKEDCPYPQALPAEDFSPSPALPATPPPAPSFSPPSAPFVPGAVSAPFVPGAPPTLSAPPTLPPALRRRGGSKWPRWLLLVVGICALGAGVYAWWHQTGPASVAQVGAPTPGTTAPAAGSATSSAPATVRPTPAGRYAPLPASESRQRAIAKHPDLARAGSPLNAKFVAAYHILESQHSPRLLQPDWPEQLADEFAGNAGATSSSPMASPLLATPKPPPAASPPHAAVVAPPPPPAASAAPLFVTLDAVNKIHASNYSYSWSPYYYADYDISFRQTVGIETTLRNMRQSSTAVTLRWMFFGRRTSNNERYVFSAAQKRIELAAGQTVSDVLDSPMIQSKAAVGYSYGTHYYSGSKYEGWLVQVLPENGDQVFKQVGSSGYIEDFGKQPGLTALLKEQLKQ